MNTNTNLKFNIVTPKKMFYSDYVKQVSFTDNFGDVVILNHHAPLIGKIERCIVEVLDYNNECHSFIVDEGAFVVANCELNFLVGFCIENKAEEWEKLNDERNKTIDILNKKNSNNWEFKFDKMLVKKIVELEKKK